MLPRLEDIFLPECADAKEDPPEKVQFQLLGW